MEVNITWSFNNSGEGIRHGHLSPDLPENKYSELELKYKIAICVVHAIIFFTALFGNSVLLRAIWKTPSLHSAANILLASIAVSDLAVGLLAQPMFIGHMLSGIHKLFKLGDILGTLLTIVSFFNITAIAVDRLLALHLHMRYLAVVTLSRATWVVVSIWVFTGIFVSSWLWHIQLFHTVPPYLFFCLLAGNFGVYLKIYHIVRRHQRHIQQQQHHLQQQENLIRRVIRFKKTAHSLFLFYFSVVTCHTRSLLK